MEISSKALGKHMHAATEILYASPGIPSFCSLVQVPAICAHNFAIGSSNRLLMLMFLFECMVVTHTIVVAQGPPCELCLLRTRLWSGCHIPLSLRGPRNRSCVPGACRLPRGKPCSPGACRFPGGGRRRHQPDGAHNGRRRRLHQAGLVRLGAGLWQQPGRQHGPHVPPAAQPQCRVCAGGPLRMLLLLMTLGRSCRHYPIPYAFNFAMRIKRMYECMGAGAAGQAAGCAGAGPQVLPGVHCAEAGGGPAAPLPVSGLARLQRQASMPSASPLLRAFEVPRYAFVQEQLCAIIVTDTQKLLPQRSKDVAWTLWKQCRVRCAN